MCRCRCSCRCRVWSRSKMSRIQRKCVEASRLSSLQPDSNRRPTCLVRIGPAKTVSPVRHLRKREVGCADDQSTITPLHHHTITSRVLSRPVSSRLVSSVPCQRPSSRTRPTCIEPYGNIPSCTLSQRHSLVVADARGCSTMYSSARRSLFTPGCPHPPPFSVEFALISHSLAFDLPRSLARSSRHTTYGLLLSVCR